MRRMQPRPSAKECAAIAEVAGLTHDWRRIMIALSLIIAASGFGAPAAGVPIGSRNENGIIGLDREE